MKYNHLIFKGGKGMEAVDDVFKQLNEQFGDELFNITEGSRDMTEPEAEQVMDEFIKKVGKSFDE